MKNIKKNNSIVLNYITLALIGIPISVLVIFLSFSLAFFGSFFGFIIGIIIFGSTSCFIFYQIKALRVKFYSLTFGLSSIALSIMWSIIIFLEKKTLVAIIPLIGLTALIFSIESGKFISKKLLERKGCDKSN